MLSIKETDFFLEIDDVLRSKIEQALHNFDQLQKDRKYQLSFSGGKDSHALAEGRYPKTYSAEWIAAEHDRIEQEQSNRERNPFYDLHLFKHL